MRNPLYLLVAAQAFFIVLGKTYLEFNITWTDIVVAIATAMVAELAFSYIERRRKGEEFKLFMPTSAVAAALGLGLFFRAVSPWYFALAALAAVGSKYLIRVKGKHIFNPSNFAVVTMVFLFPSAATIELTQWGHDILVYLLIAVIAFYIAYTAGVWVTTVSFMMSYTLLLLISIPYHLDILAVHHYGLLGPSLVLFAAFMITDPRTAPSGFYPRVLHGVAVASGFFLLEMVNVRYSLFAASFLTALLGAGSAYVMGFITPHTKLRLPQNLLACLLLLSCMGYAYVHTIVHDGVFPEFGGAIASSFLVMGVESSSIRECNQHPLYTPDPKLGISTPSMTTGAAWGDFDNDGRDDLFVSNIDVPSRLYRNTPDGFVDVTAQAGLPVLNSESAFFADYDNDGNRDLFILNSTSDYLKASAGRPVRIPAPTTVIRVFRNTGGHFTEVTAQLGLADFKLPTGAGTLSFGDYNNDGYLDFIYAEQSAYNDISFQNGRALLKSVYDPYLENVQILVCKPERVKEILSQYGNIAIPGAAAQAAYVQSGGCVMVVTKIQPRPGKITNIDNYTKNIFVEMLFRPGSVHLFENRGGKSFVEHPEFGAYFQNLYASTTEQYFNGGDHPYHDVTQSFYQPVSFDYNNDGKPDIYLSIDWSTNILMRNDGNFHFTDVTQAAGMDYAGNGMGSDVGDYTGDGKPDVVSGNIYKMYLYKNNGDGTFTNEEDRYSLNRLGIAWGVSFLDYNLDGRQDLFVGNGDVETSSNVPRLDLSRPLYRADKLYENTGNGFADVTDQAFCPVDDQLTRPIAVSDYNNDGTPDIFAGYFAYGEARTPPTLLKNTQSGRYLEVNLKGTVSNAEAVGSAVTVTSGTLVQTKFLLLGNSFNSENSHRLLFGLGTTTEPVNIEVHWPSGHKTELINVSADQILTVVEK